VRWVLGLALCSIACGPGTPTWQVRKGALIAPDGRAAVLRGMNVSGSQKNAPYLDDKQEADYLRIRREWGMNGIRFVMTWSAVEPEEGRYDDAYLDRVLGRMRWAEDAGLAVVLDMHQDVYGEGFGFDGAPRWTCDASRYAAFKPAMLWDLSVLDPNVVACVDDFYSRPDLLEHFSNAWKHVAERLRSSSAIIGFDVLNEPPWGSHLVSTFEHERLEPFYERVVAAVRSAAPEWLAFLEPAASRNVGFPTSLAPLPFFRTSSTHRTRTTRPPRRGMASIPRTVRSCSPT
jgi:endoglycosylceramidase